MPRPVLFCLPLALAACGPDVPRDAAPAAGSAAAPSAATAGTDSAAACPETGLWAGCSLEQRLEDAGFVPVRDGDDPVRRDGFGVPGVAYKLGRARLETFVYPDAAAAARDLAALDTVRAAPAGTLGDWGGPPHLIRSANLLAVLVTLNERQAERVQLALGAGPPARAP